MERHSRKILLRELKDIHLKYKTFELEDEGGEEDMIDIYLKETDEAEMLEVKLKLCFIKFNLHRLCI